MKIICTGYWKTGTKSMSKALSDLGYNVYDYAEQLFFLKSLWYKFFDGTITDEDIYNAFKDVDVIIDGPAIAFWEEIYRVFPNAKVIHTIRDEDKWWKSFKGMQDKFYGTFGIFRFLFFLSPTGYYIMHLGSKLFNYAYGIENMLLVLKWSSNERLYKLKYRKHNAYVLHTVPENKRLVHEPSHGWKPLCEYLDMEVPDKPYPHQNKDASIFTTELNTNPLFCKMFQEFKIFLCIVVVVLAAAALWFFK
uniref:Uncharacterized LOC100181738 n=1 Tax=Ciona intestinalis TaxID=7719 RepID=H2Y1Z3_CIOIN|nr:uncharacterized protein LOC100181738 [Ciona intestinalis]|eukprot:XP_002127586.1 uncharacterized protein LOC100181738 [Ciona intestinalis]